MCYSRPCTCWGLLKEAGLAAAREVFVGTMQDLSGSRGPRVQWAALDEGHDTQRPRTLNAAGTYHHDYASSR